MNLPKNDFCAFFFIYGTDSNTNIYLLITGPENVIIIKFLY